MRNILITAVALLAVQFHARLAFAAPPQNEAEAARPRIGLVLGGGGARGAAHIGVIRELERLRIPIDAIAGTSMGAVVGSLYAAGKSPDELEALVRTIDWADAFIDSPRREDLSYRRKQDDAAFPVPLELGLRGSEVVLPKGLIQGQKLQLILTQQLLGVAGIQDFDELPIPFRAVASDIETGEAYVMASGDLALAARASMSAPGIFSPVSVDGHTLVDGGLVGNVPVDVVRDMNVDVVIAVDVEFPLYPPDQLESALSISEQMLTILIRKETRRQLSTLRPGDVLIRPSLGEYGSTNFADIDEVIAPGEQAAAELAPELSRLSLSPGEYAAWLSRLRAAPFAAPVIDFVRVNSDGRLSPRVLEARLHTEPGRPLDPATVANDVDRLYGLNAYETVSYRLVDDGGRHGIVFDTRKKSWGPNFLKFGVSLEDDFEGSTAFNLAARLTSTGLNALGAEWRNDLQIGTEPEFDTEFYQPLSFDSRYFVAPHIRLGQRNLNLFADSQRVARYRISEGELGLDVGRELGRWGEFRLGIFRGAGSGHLQTGDPQLSGFDFQSGGTFARFGIDTRDDAQIPKQGLRASLQWTGNRTGLGADTRYDTVEASLDQAWSWGAERRNTLQLGLEFATTLNTDSEVQHYFPLGGFLRLSGLEHGQLSGPHAGLARLLYYREVNRTGGLFDLPLYVGGSVEGGNVWQRKSDIGTGSLLLNGSVFAGLDTWFGLLFLGAGFSEDGDSGYYLFLGNPRR